MEEAKKKKERPKTAAEIKAIEDGKRLAAGKIDKGVLRLLES